MSDDEIQTAIFTPPETTRAFFRGRSVARFTQQIASIQWDEIVFANGKTQTRVSIANPVPTEADRAKESAIRSARDYPDFLRLISGTSS